MTDTAAGAAGAAVVKTEVTPEQAQVAAVQAAHAQAAQAQAGQVRAAAAAAAAHIPAPGEIIIHGAAGDQFAIYGADLGTSGTLIVSGVRVEPVRWDETSIRGFLPRDLKPGDVVLTTSNGIRRGKFPWSSVKK